MLFLSNMLLLNYCFLILCVVTVSGFLYDDPCDVFPQYKGGIPDSPDFSTEVQVPTSCRNGTFRWDYPRGHAMLTFNNTHMIPTSICVRDRLGGDAFTIIDTNDKEVVGPFDYDHWACTDTTNKHDIVLRVDAPEELRYMGEFEYKIRH